MAAYICQKAKGSCKTCSHYRFDKERNDYSCFAKQDNLKNPTLENYKKAIEDGNLELAKQMYDKIFKK